MSAKNTASDHKIYLETFKDWRIWDKTFQLRVNAAGLWDLVDPEGNQQPMQAPPAKAPKSQGRINRGFGPTYDEEPDQADQPDQEQHPDREGQQAGSSGSAGSVRPKRNRKRKPDQSGSEAKKIKSTDNRDQDDIPICEACGGNWHTWKKCYYVFPSKAPAWFEFKPLIQDAVASRLSCQEWKDKLKFLKGAAGLAKSD
ncbi:hypothetical protein AUP68_07255 [Ilyonectria robusta]